MGRIALEGMEFYGHHGYYVDERKRGKIYIIDVLVESDIKKSGVSDELDDTINYEVIYDICKTEMSEPKHLIEKVASSIAHQIQDKYPEIEKMEVKVRKLSPDLGGPVNNAHVIFRIPGDA